MNTYNCLVTTDVLEHVSDPLENFSTMIESVKLDGYLLVANCFMPIIKCHLPRTFHFRDSFNQFVKIVGFEVVGLLKGSHATICRKVEEVESNRNKIRFYEKLSKVTFSIIELLKSILRPIKRMTRK